MYKEPGMQEDEEGNNGENDKLTVVIGYKLIHSVF